MNARIMKSAARHAAARAARFNRYAILVVLLITGGLICKARADAAPPVTPDYPIAYETSR